jgi:Fe-S-cluster containining protein
MDLSYSQVTFFEDGLRFTCTDCGQCCTGEPGAIISISQDECKAVAERLGMAPGLFVKTYTRAMGQGLSLLEKKNGDCVFFDGTRCSIYPVRPIQCRTYPFWLKNLRSEEAWEKACKECPGIGQGRLYSHDEILEVLEEDMSR